MAKTTPPLDANETIAAPDEPIIAGVPRNVFMLGAWLTYIIARAMHWTEPNVTPPLWGIPFVLVGTMLACGIVGFFIEKAAYKPMRDAPRLNVLITAIGVCLLLESIGQLPFVFGTSPQPTAKLIPEAVSFDFFSSN